MIDLHCHLLPGLDDGAGDLVTALAMALSIVEDGITVTACTPHMLPGVYPNSAQTIADALEHFAARIAEAEIPLTVVIGADVHIVPDLVEGLRAGRLLTLNRSRYFLLEPPHNTPPPRFEEVIFSVLASGFVPLVTHPERLAWIESHYPLIQRLAKSGAWMQLTAGSALGQFGKRVRYWSERMLDEGLVHVVASDGHGLKARRPLLSAARDVIAKRVGDEEAERLFFTRPRAVLDDMLPSSMPEVVVTRQRRLQPSWLNKLTRGL